MYTDLTRSSRSNRYDFCGSKTVMYSGKTVKQTKKKPGPDSPDSWSMLLKIKRFSGEVIYCFYNNREIYTYTIIPKVFAHLP